METDVIKRDSRCPLCGATMTPANLIDACSGLLNETLGVLAARCPHCQGQLEMRPGQDQIELGYCADGEAPRFDVAYTLPCPGLQVERLEAAPGLQLIHGERVWSFSA
jgi:hypothetical protein